MPPLVRCTLAKQGKNNTATAQGLVAQMRAFGGSIGVSASFIVLNARIQEALASVLTPQQLDDFYRSPAATLTFSPLQQLRVRETYVDSFSINMRVCVGMAAACLVASLCTYQRNPPSVKKRLEDLEALFARSAAASGAAADPDRPNV